MEADPQFIINVLPFAIKTNGRTGAAPNPNDDNPLTARGLHANVSF